MKRERQLETKGLRKREDDWDKERERERNRKRKSGVRVCERSRKKVRKK